MDEAAGGDIIVRGSWGSERHWIGGLKFKIAPAAALAERQPEAEMSIPTSFPFFRKRFSVILYPMRQRISEKETLTN